jgi:hypothetical protein
MSYLPPFDVIKEKFRVVGGLGRARIDMKQSDFVDLLKLMLRAVDVKEEWYLAHYPDVAEAIKAGAYKSGKHHFVEEGYFEGRVPYEFAVDEQWYKSNYPDIAVGMQSGTLGSPKEHFLAHGYKEGRLPAEY